jgi:hypothetical protein
MAAVKNKWSDRNRVARFFLVQLTKTGKMHQMTTKYTYLPYNILNVHSIYSKWQLNIPALSIPGPSKINPNWYFRYENIAFVNPGQKCAKKWRNTPFITFQNQNSAYKVGTYVQHENTSLKSCLGGVAQWSLHPPEKQTIWVRIPPGYTEVYPSFVQLIANVTEMKIIFFVKIIQISS